MPIYKAPLEDVGFLLNDVFQIDRYDNLPGFTDATRDSRELYLTPYFQDDWKISPRLTLNIGLRYEWVSNPKFVIHQAEALPSAPYGNFVPVTHAFATNPSNYNFNPRVGLAYAITPKLSVTLLEGSTPIRQPPAG